MSIELNLNLLHWYFQQYQCLAIKKHAVPNIHILYLYPFNRAQRVHALRRYCS